MLRYPWGPCAEPRSGGPSRRSTDTSADVARQGPGISRLGAEAAAAERKLEEGISAAKTGVAEAAEKGAGVAKSKAPASLEKGAGHEPVSLVDKVKEQAKEKVEEAGEQVKERSGAAADFFRDTVAGSSTKAPLGTGADATQVKKAAAAGVEGAAGTAGIVGESGTAAGTVGGPEISASNPLYNAVIDSTQNATRNPLYETGGTAVPSPARPAGPSAVRTLFQLNIQLLDHKD